jgi:hypothetical protein
MSYTREQAEEVLKDRNKWQGAKLPIYDGDIKFLNHKFGQQLEVGKWYKNDCYNSKVCYQGNGVGFGTWSGVWGRSWGIYYPGWQPMTEEEVHDFLKSECEKIFKVGDVVRSVLSGAKMKIDRFSYNINNQYLYCDNIAVLDLNTGEWAEVIKKDPIAEQIEKLEKELETLKTKYNEQNK